MNCRQFDSRLDSYLDGEIDAPRRAQMDGHAAGCPACRAQMEALRQAERALRVPEFHAAPPGMLGEFHRRLDHASRRPALAWPWAAGTALAAAAALAAFVLLPPSRPTSDLPSSGEASRTVGPKPPSGQASSPAARPLAPRVIQPAPSAGSREVRAPKQAAPLETGKHAPQMALTTPPRSPVVPGTDERKPVEKRFFYLDRATSAAPALHSVVPPARRGEPSVRPSSGPAVAAPAIAARNQPPAPEALSVAPAAVSPALIAAMQRPVTLSVDAEPAAEAAAKLGEAGDLAVRVEGDGDKRVSFQSQGAPLWQALQTVAQESGLVIEPNGDGVRLTRLALADAPRGAAAAGRRGVEREQPPQQSRDRLRQQTREAEARSQQQLPAVGQLLAERQQPEKLPIHRELKAESPVWSLAWGDLPAQQFGEPSSRLTSAKKLASAPTMKETFRAAPAPAAGMGGRAMGGGNLGGGAGPGGFGGGGFGGIGGGFGAGGPRAAGRGGVAPAPADAPQRAASARSFGASAPAPEHARRVLRAGVPAQDAAVPPAAGALARTDGGWVTVADGRLLLVRAAGTSRYALLQPSRTRVGKSVGLSYRVWLRPEAGEHYARKAALAGTLSKKPSGSGPPRIEIIGGALTWEPGTNGEVRFRVLSGDLELCPTPDRDAAKVDPADAKWNYR